MVAELHKREDFLEVLEVGAFVRARESDGAEPPRELLLVDVQEQRQQGQAWLDERAGFRQGVEPVQRLVVGIDHAIGPAELAPLETANGLERRIVHATSPIQRAGRATVVW
jgi:hypothetical protein